MQPHKKLVLGTGLLTGFKVAERLNEPFQGRTRMTSGASCEYDFEAHPTKNPQLTLVQDVHRNNISIYPERSPLYVNN